MRAAVSASREAAAASAAPSTAYILTGPADTEPVQHLRSSGGRRAQARHLGAGPSAPYRAHLRPVRVRPGGANSLGKGPRASSSEVSYLAQRSRGLRSSVARST